MGFVSYEERLGADLGWAMAEGSLYFEGSGAVQKTLHRVTARLDQLGIAYAVVGGMALFAHGYRRFTEDVDLIVTAEGLQQAHQALRGRGYLPPFEASKQLRDTETGVRVEFLVSGGYPGDGKPKDVSFPEPANQTTAIGGIAYLKLERLIELKLASGMSAPHRVRDLADVVELIRLLALPLELGEQLAPSVRPEYEKWWRASAASTDDREPG